MDNSSQPAPIEPPKEASSNLGKIILSFNRSISLLIIIGIILMIQNAFSQSVTFLSVSQRVGFGVPITALIYAVGISSFLSVLAVLVLIGFWIFHDTSGA